MVFALTDGQPLTIHQKKKVFASVWSTPHHSSKKSIVMRYLPFEIQKEKVSAFVVIKWAFWAFIALFVFTKAKGLLSGGLSFLGLTQTPEQKAADARDKIDSAVSNNSSQYRYKDGTIATPDRINGDSVALQNALGTDSFFSVTEDEQKAYSILRKHTKASFRLLKTAYESLSLSHHYGSIEADIEHGLAGETFLNDVRLLYK